MYLSQTTVKLNNNWHILSWRPNLELSIYQYGQVTDKHSPSPVASWIKCSCTYKSKISMLSTQEHLKIRKSYGKYPH